MEIFGAVIGDIVGSRYEFANHRSKDFPLFGDDCRFTDDSLMTIAVAAALTDCGDKSDKELADSAISHMCRIAALYPYAGYGSSFLRWLFSDGERRPYNSLGNGAAMRVSPVGYYARTERDVKRLSGIVTGITHNHPEGLKGAECTAMAVFYALNGKSKADIVKLASFYYPTIPELSCDELRKTYSFDVTCGGTVPQAMACFNESADFEDALRLAVSIGGDTDTLCAIAGAVAGAYYGIPSHIGRDAARFLPPSLLGVMDEFFGKASFRREPR